MTPENIKPINLKEVRAWLETKQLHETVGRSRIDNACIIAQYLIEVNEAEKVRVRYDDITFTTEGIDYAVDGVPESVKLFMRNLDDERTEVYTVTALQALNMLDILEKPALEVIN